MPGGPCLVRRLRCEGEVSSTPHGRRAVPHIPRRYPYYGLAVGVDSSYASLPGCVPRDFPDVGKIHIAWTLLGLLTRSTKERLISVGPGEGAPPYPARHLPPSAGSCRRRKKLDERQSRRSLFRTSPRVRLLIKPAVGSSELSTTPVRPLQPEQCS